MGPDSYAVAQPEQLLALPGPPLTENQRELLCAFLRNPFLDEDTQGLAARTGLRRDELHEGLEALVEAGMLKSAGRRGFMLDLEALDPEIEYAVKLLPLLEPAVEEKGAEPADIASAELLPFGMALFSPEGTQLAANAEIGRLLELPLEELDAAAFVVRTGCDLVLLCAAGASTTFPLENSAFEVQVLPRPYGEGLAMLVIIQDRGMHHQITQAHIQIQEELFAQLNDEVTEPLQLIRTYLENSDMASLGTARAAFEQVEMVLQSFMLQARPED